MATSEASNYARIEHNWRAKTSGSSRRGLLDRDYPHFEQIPYSIRPGGFPGRVRPAAMRRMDAGLNKFHLGAMRRSRTSTPRKESARQSRAARESRRALLRMISELRSLT